MAAKRTPIQKSGLVSTPPVSALKTLRLLEGAYARQGAELDKAKATIVALRKRLKVPKGMPDE